MQNRNFKNICWLGSQRKVKCKCNLDSSIDSSGEGWNVLIFWWKWKINILTISRNIFSIFYWLETSKSFCFLETVRLNLKTSKCLERCYFLFLSYKTIIIFLNFLKSALVHLLWKYISLAVCSLSFSPGFLVPKSSAMKNFPPPSSLSYQLGFALKWNWLRKCHVTNFLLSFFSHKIN